MVTSITPGADTGPSVVGAGSVMSYCEHCQGQRFDRARVLRALRQIREGLRDQEGASQADQALVLALNAVRALEIPHLEPVDEDDHVVH